MTCRLRRRRATFGRASAAGGAGPRIVRRPFLVVLDEPSSNLDEAGEAALTSAIHSVRARGGIVIVVAHRPGAIVAVDHLLVINRGRMHAFGAKEEILSRMLRPETPATPLKVVASGMSN